MALQVWYLIASLFLLSINGHLVKDNGPRFYERPETSSPAPSSSPAPDQQLAGMKEVVLFLTADQVRSLQAAGVIVKPFPQFEKDLLQQQYQQSGEESTEPQYPPDTANKDPKQADLDEFYKLLNVQQINEDLSVQSQSEESATEKPRQKYKYTPKLRQQYYSALYTQKKANKAKTSSTEYVRYLPNYEIEELKNTPYRAQPIQGYYFNAPRNNEVPTYYQTPAPQLQKYEGIRRPEEIQVENIPPRTLTINEPEQPQLQQQSPAKVETFIEDKGPVTFTEKDFESAKPWASIKVQEPPKIWEPANTWESAKNEETEEIEAPLNIQRFPSVNLPKKYQNVQIPPDGEIPVQEEKPKNAPQESPSAIIQSQISSLLAPLVQHDKIAESIAKEKQELIKHEEAIQNKLKQLKESGPHDELRHAIEIDKLNRNLGKQNALAQRLALEISKKSEAQLKEIAFEKRKEQEIVKQVQNPETAPVLVSIPKPVEAQTPRPYTTPSTDSQENIESSEPTDDKKHISIPGTRNVYVKIDDPYIVQKVVPVALKHDIPVRYRQPDELVLRPLWEHK